MLLFRIMSRDESATNWPGHTFETVTWRQRQRAGNREDRTLSSIKVSIPPMIASLSYRNSRTVELECDEAQIAISRLDAGAGKELAPLAAFLTRIEAVSSSKIEYLEASLDDYARAVGGVRSNSSASSMVTAGEALKKLIDRAGATGKIELESILVAHRALMHDDPRKEQYAGKLRSVQNWIGGSDYSPRGAIHVPPIPERVEPLMVDLIEFANRDDISVITQAAIVHAQFESIHPFTDGNGRIGRALINAVFRRRGLTRHLVVPIASAMGAHRQLYFDLVNGYRTGNVESFTSLLARSAAIAATEAAIAGEELSRLPEQWLETSNPRKGSAAAKLLETLLLEPVLTLEVAERVASAPISSLYSALARLTEDGVLNEVTGRKRDRIYVASDVMGALDSLERRIEARARQIR